MPDLIAFDESRFNSVVQPLNQSLRLDETHP